MTARRTVATAVLAVFLTGLVPAPSFAASETSATAPVRQSGGSTTSLRDAGRKAVTELVKDAPTHATLAVTPSARQSSRTSRRAQSNGGGSKVLPTVLTLVGVAASVGVTYYAVKEMKKSTPTTGQ